VRANVLRLLDERERTIAWLARKMAEQGCTIAKTGLWKSLRQDRHIMVDEALAMAQVLDVTLDQLIEEQS
jgi:hypothetical protein